MDSNEGYLLISVTTTVLLAFVVCFLIIMIIYRKRKVEHAREVELMNERFEKELLNTQLEIQQQTMQYIGREIHDNVGQKLTLASLYTQQAEAVNNLEASKEKIISVSTIINESLADLRSLSKSLTESASFKTNLYELINNECKKINASDVCKVFFESNTEEVNVSQPVKNVVLRILQEFIQNSLKHSGCTEIKITLQNERDGLHIFSEDNGKGFTLNQNTSTGIGLKNIQKRAEIIGAALLLESTPGKGTAIKLFIPLDKII